jgi:RNA polymerase sigma-70 factor (subfamily 1)
VDFVMSVPNRSRVWIERAAAGDHVALQKLLALYHPRLEARLLRKLEPKLRAKYSADDILQEVYLEVFQQVGTFRYKGSASFYHWLCSILDHKLVDLHRAFHARARDVSREVHPHGDKDTSYDRLVDQLPRDSITPSRIVGREELLDLLPQGLACLPEDHRRVLELRYLQGKSLAETGEAMGRSEVAVSALCRRALDRLCVVIREHFAISARDLDS